MESLRTLNDDLIVYIPMLRHMNGSVVVARTNNELSISTDSVMAKMFAMMLVPFGQEMFWQVNCAPSTLGEAKEIAQGNVPKILLFFDGTDSVEIMLEEAQNVDNQTTANQ